ncbi:MAG: hypothetical protein ABI112_04325 [Terracoccus sp.]
MRRPLAIVALAVAAPLLVACEGDSTSSPAPVVSTRTSSSPTPTESSSPTSTAEPTPSTLASAAVDPADAKYCDALKSGGKEINRITSGSFNTSSLKKFSDAVAKIQATAPDRIKPAWNDFLDLLKKAAAGDTDVITSAGNRMKAIGERIDRDAVTSCGFTRN